MKATVNRVNSRTNINRVSQIISKILVEIAEDLLIELTNSSKKKLNMTIQGTLPRGVREKYGQKGFDRANVSVIKSSIVDTGRGARIQLTIRVTDGSSDSPHKVWHWINAGFQSGVSAKNRNIPIRKNTRTKIGNLNTAPFEGYTGEWRTIKAGERPAPVAPRKWYKTALDEIDREVISKYGMLFDFTKKEANDD